MKTNYTKIVIQEINKIIIRGMQLKNSRGKKILIRGLMAA